MEISLYGELLMEIRRLHVAGTSFGVSKHKKIREVIAELNRTSPSLHKIITIVESDPGLSVAVIKLANCTIVNGASLKKITVKQAMIRIGLVGIDSALKVYQASILKRVVSNKNWRDYMDKALEQALTAGALSYNVAMKLTGKRSDAEQALNLAILYSLGVFAKIIAADSMGLENNKNIREVVLENSAIAAQAVLITANASFQLIQFIEKIESESVNDVSVLAARAGWGFLKGTMDTLSFNDIELNRKSF